MANSNGVSSRHRNHRRNSFQRPAGYVLGMRYKTWFLLGIFGALLIALLAVAYFSE